MSDDTLRDHWYWRPGWRVGRSFYTWHVTFDGQATLAELVDHYAPLIADLGVHNSVPLRWLHLTMQGVGFTDEVPQSQLQEMVEAARVRCGDLSRFDVTVGPPVFDPEALIMPVQPAEPLHQLRIAVRAAIGDVFGDIPEAADGYRPHVSLGYTNTTGPADLVVPELVRFPTLSARARVDAVSLIDLNRDRRMYEWTPVADVPLR